MAASIVIGGVEISVGAKGCDREGRTIFGYSIVGEGVDHHGNDLRSGCGSHPTRHFKGGRLSPDAASREDRGGLASLLSFLGAAAEAYGYTMRTGRESDNAGLFPAEIAEWAYINADEISMAAFEYEGA